MEVNFVVGGPKPQCREDPVPRDELLYGGDVEVDLVDGYRAEGRRFLPALGVPDSQAHPLSDAFPPSSRVGVDKIKT